MLGRTWTLRSAGPELSWHSPPGGELVQIPALPQRTVPLSDQRPPAPLTLVSSLPQEGPELVAMVVSGQGVAEMVMSTC